MNPYYKEKLRALLAGEIERATEDIARLEEGVQPVAPDRALGRITRMEVLSDKARNEAALDQLQGQLRDLEDALAQIDNEGFGQCRGCRQPIPDERLLAVPGTKWCVGCSPR